VCACREGSAQFIGMHTCVGGAYICVLCFCNRVFNLHMNNVSSPHRSHSCTTFLVGVGGVAACPDRVKIYYNVMQDGRIMSWWAVQGRLSMQKLWFFIQPCLKTLTLLASVAADIHAVQNLLWWTCDDVML